MDTRMSTQIHPTAIVDDKAILGQDVIIGPYSIIGPHVTLGDRTRCRSHVIIEGHTAIGADCDIYPFVSLGTDPQDVQYKGEPTQLLIGHNNIIREYVTMNRGSNKEDGITQVGNHGMFMIGVHIAHDCKVGDYVVMANQASMGGHVHIGDYVILGGLCAIHQFVHVGDHAMIGGMSRVANDVIPFGMARGPSAHLTGLNIVGLRRRGFDREEIFELRKAYRLLFVDEGTMEDRLYNTESMFSDSEPVMRLIDFIRTESSRSLMTEQTV
jgi:UDP-N-acetylglucosamine acyltransferase